MENLNNVVITTNENSVNADSNVLASKVSVNDVLSIVGSTKKDEPKDEDANKGLKDANLPQSLQVVNLPKIAKKLEPIFNVNAELLKGLPLETKRNIYKTVEFASKKPIPNFGGELQILVVFENSYTVKSTETKATNEFIKNVEKKFLPIVLKGEDKKPIVDELGNVTLIEDNVIKTGNKDSLGRETYFVKTTSVIKGWKQIRTNGETTEQQTLEFYPYIFTVSEDRANDFSFILGAAIKLHQKNLLRMEIEKNNNYKYSGNLHCTFNLGGETISTKMVSDKGIKSQLIKSDFKAFCKGLFLRMKDAIAQRTETIETVDIDKMFA